MSQAGNETSFTKLTEVTRICPPFAMPSLVTTRTDYVHRISYNRLFKLICVTVH